MKWVKASERLPEVETRKNIFVKEWNFDEQTTFNSTAVYEPAENKFFKHDRDSWGSKREAKIEFWLDESPLPSNEDELWEEVKEILKESWVADSFINKLKNKFSITRR